MSKNRNRVKFNKAQTQKEYKIILINFNYPLYWDDGIIEYPRFRKGFKNPNKRIYKYQQRSYRTWKYNRKTKYKI